MQITALEITDYKRVRKVAITPAADVNVILIGGKNGAGKSSTLDALTAAFGGAKQLASDPVRHGADEAAIFVELDGGKLTIDRVIGADGKTTLEVRDPEGVVRSPQAALDKLVGARFLDPLAFLQLAAKEQRAQLMKLIPDADRIEQLDAKRAKAFERRTELGRDLKKAEGELARLPEVTPGKPIDVAALSEELRGLADKQRAGDGLGHAHREAVHDLETAEAVARRSEERIAEIERQLEQERAVLRNAHAAIATATARAVDVKVKLDVAIGEWTSLAPRRDELEKQLAIAAEHNRAIGAAEADARRRAEAITAVDKHGADLKACTGAIATIDERKASILGAAKLPVDGLTIGDDGILLGGVPFAQGSDAEKWRVALALAIAASPGLNDVWIRDGALLDDDSLDLVAKHAHAAGKRIWIERVGTKDPGVIVIQDGQVAS